LAFLIKLCQKNKIDVVIEGIETPEMYKVFRKMGATYLQGYWFSKPLSIASASRYTLAPMSDS
jgi:EAL domain-containing protein (putative c-di-GMP-specific phosphodiesterase class I)